MTFGGGEMTVNPMVNLNTFHLDTMVWSTVDIPVEFQISKDLLGQGGFRKAYRAKSNTQEFSNAEWVVKRYKTSVLKEIEAINQTVEQHTRKVVQMHHLARNFAAQLTQVVLDQDLRDLFAETFSYKTLASFQMGNMSLLKNLWKAKWVN